MRSRGHLVVIVAVLAALPCPALACSLCGALSGGRSFVYEFQEASMVVFGTLANPRLGPGGKGTTEFHFEKIIKSDPKHPLAHKGVLLSRYLPILDPKMPPRYVMFFQSSKPDAEPYWGREVTSSAAVEFARAVLKHSGVPDEMLVFAARHFDHADATVAEEAFLLFAKADDKSVARVAKRLDPATLRKLTRSPDVEPERLSMFAYLLGVCGTAEDAEILRTLLNNKSARHYKAYEGILAGYIAIRPKEGWALAEELLTNPKTEFLVRYAVLRTLRFFYNARPDETGPNVLRGWSLALRQPDVADVAVNDLRKFKRWEHTKQVLALYDQPGPQSPILRGSIERYAIACPLPEMRPLVDRLRKQNPDLFKELEADLK